jgi:hypothetical protein
LKPPVISALENMKTIKIIYVLTLCFLSSACSADGGNASESEGPLRKISPKQSSGDVKREKSALTSFQGKWSYRQTCGYEHAADITLVQKDKAVTGVWDDGTRIGGWFGNLKGDIRDAKLFMRFCSSDPDAKGYAACPNYNEDESDYFVKKDTDLIWYRAQGEGNRKRFKKYLILHDASSKNVIPIDRDCTEEVN